MKESAKDLFFELTRNKREGQKPLQALINAVEKVFDLRENPKVPVFEVIKRGQTELGVFPAGARTSYMLAEVDEAGDLFFHAKIYAFAETITKELIEEKMRLEGIGKKVNIAIYFDSSEKEPPDHRLCEVLDSLPSKTIPWSDSKLLESGIVGFRMTRVASPHMLFLDLEKEKLYFDFGLFPIERGPSKDAVVYRKEQALEALTYEKYTWEDLKTEALKLKEVFPYE